MEVDEPYAEYVAARWSMLYRLAVLLVGEPSADDLTQTAFVEAYLAWAEVQEAASADDHLKRILARAAARQPAALADDHPATEDAPGLGRRERLWARLGALPPLCRAMVVLRDYEALTEVEVADVLGCPATTIATELAAWDEGVDRVALREELVARADGVDVPLPPTAALLARGHEQRRRRTGRRVRWTLAAALVVVVALALASVLQGNASDRSATPRLPPLPASVAELADGRAPGITYSTSDLLDLAGGPIQLPDSPTALVTTRTGVYLSLPSGWIVRVPFETGVPEPVARASAGQLVSDPSGDRVAWLRKGQGKAWVTVGTVGSVGAALLGREQPVPARCCEDPVRLDGITGSGAVIVSAPGEGRSWVWDSARGRESGADPAFREITGLGNGVVNQVTAGEVVAQYGASHFAAGVLDGDAFFVTYEINARQADFADPLGERVLYVDEAGETHVRERRTHGRPRTPESVRLQLPLLPQGYHGVRWEDPDHVLLDVPNESAPGGALVRCDVHSGRCAVAVHLDGPHLLAR